MHLGHHLSFGRVYFIFFSLMASLTSSSTTSAAAEPSFKKASEVMQVKRLSENAVLPTRGSVYAAGSYCVLQLTGIVLLMKRSNRGSQFMFPSFVYVFSPSQQDMIYVLHMIVRFPLVVKDSSRRTFLWPSLRTPTPALPHAAVSR